MIRRCRKLRLGWAIAARRGVDRDSYLCIFDQDLRMGLRSEKVIFRDRDLAVEQIRSMRRSQRTGEQWVAFEDLKLVSIFKWIPA